ncbi:MAG: hypothetical protein LBJ41_05340 [Treponema sp.]|nr:hypothetical protein [Treponema sp.]
MLQQTQAKRVIPYWERWMWLWSTSADLNKATLEEALRKWSGLGYNRCCRFLKDCARVITEERRRGARHFRSLVTVVGHWCIPCGRYCLFCL